MLPSVSENDLSQETKDLILGCSSSASKFLGLDLAASTAEELVHGVDEIIFALQTGNGPVWNDDEKPMFLFGSLWGDQLVRKLDWSWKDLTFHEFEDARTVGVVSPNSGLVIYPFYFIEACLEEDTPVTIELAFNMLCDGSSIPVIPAKSYENVMEYVHHIVPR